jgi:parallel beta-helix repeat protein
VQDSRKEQQALPLRARPHAGPATLPALATIVALAAALILVAGSGPAFASPISCGDTITTDTTLEADLIDCPSNGVVIGADDITLDLNGHVIDGDGTEFADCGKREFCDVGILDIDHDGVTLRDGSTRGFSYGVFVGSAHGSRLLSISAKRNTFFGVVIGRSSRALVRNCSLSNNIPPEGDGIGLFESDHIRVRRNSIRRNAGPGIHISDSNNNLIKGNVFSQDGPAIAVEGNGNAIRDNDIIDGGGIRVSPGNRNTIIGNRVSRAEESLTIEEGRGNLVARNVVIGARGNGIRLGLDRPAIGGVGNVLRGNLVRRSGEDGFRVDGMDSRSLLRRNIAVASGDDGFDVESKSAKLTGNRAVRNSDLGIEAVWGVIDGSANRAAHNGAARQCKNIVCG